MAARAASTPWGAGPFVIEVDGKSFRFDDSDRFGPYIITSAGDIATRQPTERSPFWRVHRIWVRQGRRVENERCLWDEPKPTLFKSIGKRSGLIVENGEEDGRHVCVGQATMADVEPSTP